MKSPVTKRSVVVRGHKTSVSLEDAFWNSLKEIGGERHMTLSDLSLQLIPNDSTIICHWPFGFSCSTSIARSFPKQTDAGTKISA